MQIKLWTFLKNLNDNTMKDIHLQYQRETSIQIQSRLKSIYNTEQGKILEYIEWLEDIAENAMGVMETLKKLNTLYPDKTFKK